MINTFKSTLRVPPESLEREGKVKKKDEKQAWKFRSREAPEMLSGRHHSSPYQEVDMTCLDCLKLCTLTAEGCGVYHGGD